MRTLQKEKEAGQQEGVALAMMLMSVLSPKQAEVETLDTITRYVLELAFGGADGA